jgi:hypothetical protein
MPWISSDLFENNFINHTTTVYSLGNVYDPMVSNKFDDKWKHTDFLFDLIYKLSSEKKSLKAIEFVT